jgi:hypothetical protein
VLFVWLASLHCSRDDARARVSGSPSGIVHGDSEATFKTQIVALCLAGATNTREASGSWILDLPKSLSEKFRWHLCDGRNTVARARKGVPTGWRNRNKATGLTKPTPPGSRSSRQLPPMPRLPSSHSGPNVQPEEEEMKHDTDEEQWEVDDSTPKGRLQPMRGDDRRAVCDGRRQGEMKESDYPLPLQASFRGTAAQPKKTR